MWKRILTITIGREGGDDWGGSDINEIERKGKLKKEDKLQKE